MEPSGRTLTASSVASRYQFYNFGYQQITPAQTLNNPQYDVSAEIGGYIPGFREKLFFFGAFDPSLTQTIYLANPKSTVTYAHGIYPSDVTTMSWSGKLTYKLASSTTLEASSFGDPSRHNAIPNTFSTNNPLSVTSSYNFGTRDIDRAPPVSPHSDAGWGCVLRLQPRITSPRLIFGERISDCGLERTIARPAQPAL